MKVLDAARHRPLAGGASFTLGNRIFRAVWATCWIVLARWTPAPLHRWRRALLRLFGAELAPSARVHASARVWYPPHLRMDENALLGPRVECYNQGHISIGAGTVISQGAHLCASSHDVSDPHFQLVPRPIAIGERAWVAADAFIGPGCTVGAGAVIGARAALFEDAEPWGIYRGNPARLVKHRTLRGEEP